jgi:hypothetical protein
MSANALSRALFLTLAFPRIIASGRKWYTTSSEPPPETHIVDRPPTSTVAHEGQTVTGEAEEPALPPEPTDVDHGSQFDLVFVRWSMIVDALLTAMTMFASEAWHMYLGMFCSLENSITTILSDELTFDSH